LPTYIAIIFLVTELTAAGGSDRRRGRRSAGVGLLFVCGKVAVSEMRPGIETSWHVLCQDCMQSIPTAAHRAGSGEAPEKAGCSDYCDGRVAFARRRFSSHRRGGQNDGGLSRHTPLFLGRHDVSYSDLVSLDAGFDDRVGGFSRAQWIGASMRAWGVAGGKSQKRPTEGGRAREKTSRLGGGGFFLAVWAAVSRGKEGRGGEGGARQAASELLAGGLVLRGGERRGGLGGTHYNK